MWGTGSDSDDYYYWRNQGYSISDNWFTRMLNGENSDLAEERFTFYNLDPFKEHYYLPIQQLLFKGLDHSMV